MLNSDWVLLRAYVKVMPVILGQLEKAEQGITAALHCNIKVSLGYEAVGLELVLLAIGFGCLPRLLADFNSLLNLTWLFWFVRLEDRPSLENQPASELSAPLNNDGGPSLLPQ